MSQYEPATNETVSEVLKRFAKYIGGIEPEYLDSVTDEVNGMLDNLLGDDFFGTEGQCDPRGDHRD